MRILSRHNKKTGPPLNCPYCKETTLGSFEVAACSKCNTIHHVECWDENHACAVFGCSGAAILVKPEDQVIRIFQERRKLLLLTSAFPLTAAAFVLAFSSVMESGPQIGVLMFFALCLPWILVLLGLQDAYFRCPACGKHPLRIDTPSKYFGPYGDLSFLGTNPRECRHCHIRLK